MNSDKHLGPTGRGGSPHVRLCGPWSFKNSGLISAMIYSAEQISAARGEEEKQTNRRPRSRPHTTAFTVRTTTWKPQELSAPASPPRDRKHEKCDADRGERPQPRPSTRNSVMNVRSETHELISGIPEGAVRKRSQGGLP